MHSIGDPLSALLDQPGLAALGPQPRPGVLSQPDLEKQLAAIFSSLPAPPPNPQLIQGLLLLWHDHLGPAHTIAQEIETPNGSLLHALMHRREPDYSNAKYWFRRAGHHPSFAHLPRYLQAPIPPADERKFGLNFNLWDPFAFVDACQKAAPSSTLLLQQIQKAEFQSFLDHLLA